MYGRPEITNSLVLPIRPGLPMPGCSPSNSTAFLIRMATYVSDAAEIVSNERQNGNFLPVAARTPRRPYSLVSVNTVVLRLEAAA